MAAPQGVNFDGTNDYLTRGGDLTGNADSKLVTFAFWIRFASATSGSLEAVWDSSSSLSSAARFRVNRDSSEQLVISARNAANSQILFVNTSAASFADTDWHHVLFSRNGTTVHLYVDDVSDATVSTNADDTIDFAAGGTVEHAVGETFIFGGPSGFKLPGDLADFWLAPGVYIDLSVEANRRKFVGASAANAVDLGSDGSTPTGSAPIVFLSGATADWHTNKGTGEGFTENGALTDASANPPDYAGAGGGINRAVALYHARYHNRAA